MSIGFGIIGCGMIAHFHARAIDDVRGARLVACYDKLPAAADKLAEATGCKAYHDLDAMLADPAVEVVDDRHAQRGASRAGTGRRSGRQARHRRKAAGNHARAAATRSSRPATRPASCSPPSSNRGSTRRAWN